LLANLTGHLNDSNGALAISVTHRKLPVEKFPNIRVSTGCRWSVSPTSMA
jgi:hypothetical protein